MPPPATTNTTPTTTMTKSKLDNILERYSESNQLPCALGAVVTRDKGLVYLGGRGRRDAADPTATPAGPDTPLAFFSCTKAVTTTALLQLLERGLIRSIDDPVEHYVPEIRDIPVLVQAKDGTQQLQAPATKPTLRHLLTHTAGFSYPFFSHAYAQLQHDTGTPDILRSTWDEFKTPLLFEPGTRWHYGVNTDWVGKVVYEVSGLSLGEYCRRHIFAPLAAHTLTFDRTPGLRAAAAELHQRAADGTLAPLRGALVDDPQFHPGGHGLYGTVADYMKFLEIFLHEGRSPATGEQILRPDTVAAYSLADLLPPGVHVESSLQHSQPALSNKVDLFDRFPPDKQGWTASFHKIDVALPTGRAAASYSWAGLPNLYYWIDPARGVAGMFATQLFPFCDATALAGFAEFETAAYAAFA